MRPQKEWKISIVLICYQIQWQKHKLLHKIHIQTQYIVWQKKAAIKTFELEFRWCFFPFILHFFMYINPDKKVFLSLFTHYTQVEKIKNMTKIFGKSENMLFVQNHRRIRKSAIFKYHKQHDSKWKCIERRSKK